MAVDVQAVAKASAALLWDRVVQKLYEGLEGRFTRQRLLVLVPDHTRTMPLLRLFPVLADILRDTKALDFMVALGTHPPLEEETLYALFGLTPQLHRSQYSHIGLLNHAWDCSEALIQIGTLTRDQLQALAGRFWHPSLSHDVPVRINRAALQCDHILILGPTFPHEVAGFSGGAKYLFPGISGPEMIHTSHWLGALVGIDNTIGVRDTPVRAMIHTAAAELGTPVTLASFVIAGDEIAGLFIGDYVSAWRAAADLSARRHIRWHRRPFRRVLSCAAPMYDELWTAAKAVYKLAPAVADGGEIILYAPHLETVSRTHDRHIDRVGYHVLDYFLKQWERFDDVPLGVLAHSTHVRGAGRYTDGVELPRVRVVLASRVSRQRCQSLALEYLDPADVDLAAWQARAAAEGQDHDTLVEPHAGEILHRVGTGP